MIVIAVIDHIFAFLLMAISLGVAICIYKKRGSWTLACLFWTLIFVRYLMIFLFA